MSDFSLLKCNQIWFLQRLRNKSDLRPTKVRPLLECNQPFFLLECNQALGNHTLSRENLVPKFGLGLKPKFLDSV